ncbi:peptidyl-tRNA hydrolase PTH2-domain-containing protein [Mycena maculata]|uniref:peptidyl-tRNA hydrolase n=1 Tax=Mycena maculata TaxID=230809 RepID=A0AAD7KFC7_9AGAR|nr:peptidyl-tRNA hydrolase PTH2-domain-containing protein [Mycena maculata]
MALELVPSFGNHTVAAYIFVVATSLSLGYYTARASVPLPNAATSPPRPRQPEGDSDSESEEGPDVSTLTTLDECKLVLVVRTDLGMTTGKIAAQCSHATLACYKTLSNKNPPLLRRWALTGYLKSVVRCSDEDELLMLQAQAQSLNLCACSIQDAGRTQIAAGSTTVLGIAGPSMLVEQVTQQLAAF